MLGRIQHGGGVDADGLVQLQRIGGAPEVVVVAVGRAVVEDEEIADAVDAVGHPDALELAIRLARKCGTVSVVGVYAERVQVHMGLAWIKSLNMVTGHANVIAHVDPRQATTDVGRTVLVVSEAVPQRNVVGVLVDDSRSMRIADLDGVVALEVELASSTVRVEGDVSAEAVWAAVLAVLFAPVNRRIEGRLAPGLDDGLADEPRLLADDRSRARGTPGRAAPRRPGWRLQLEGVDARRIVRPGELHELG